MGLQTQQSGYEVLYILLGVDVHPVFIASDVFISTVFLALIREKGPQTHESGYENPYIYKRLRIH